eukprot:COSAG02_NODE_59359_length_274_cov_0.954286_1_plen_27_part_10
MYHGVLVHAAASPPPPSLVEAQVRKAK